MTKEKEVSQFNNAPLLIKGIEMLRDKHSLFYLQVLICLSSSAFVTCIKVFLWSGGRKKKKSPSTRVPIMGSMPGLSLQRHTSVNNWVLTKVKMIFAHRQEVQSGYLLCVSQP